MDERRSSGRFPLELSVEFEADEHGSGTCSCKNISLGGICVLLPESQTLNIGTKLNLHFQLPGLDETVSVSGDVCWKDRIRSEIVGIQFATGLRAREVWAIHQLRKSA